MQLWNYNCLIFSGVIEKNYILGRRSQFFGTDLSLFSTMQKNRSCENLFITSTKSDWKCFSKSCVWCLPAAHLKTEFWQAIITFASVQMSSIAKGGLIFIYLCLGCVHVSVSDWTSKATCLCARSKGWSIMGSFPAIPGVLVCDSEWYPVLHFFYLKKPCCSLPVIV